MLKSNIFTAVLLLVIVVLLYGSFEIIPPMLKPDPQVGDAWVFDVDDDPFTGHYVYEVLAIKNGYVKYRYAGLLEGSDSFKEFKRYKTKVSREGIGKGGMYYED